MQQVRLSRVHLAMNDTRDRSQELRKKLGMELSPVGVFLYEEIPGYAVPLKKKTRGCIAALMYMSAKGKIFVFDEETTGRSCASFYLGYQDWIFPGIEKFLSNECVNDREPERFLKNPEIAKKMIEHLVPEKKRTGTIICKPLELCLENEQSELVIFFANPDQLSALVFLTAFGAPLEDRIETRFASACMSMFTLPIKYAEEGKKKAVWGFHDLSARLSIPKDLTSLTMTFDLFNEVCENSYESFLGTETWERVRSRNG